MKKISITLTIFLCLLFAVPAMAQETQVENNTQPACPREADGRIRLDNSRGPLEAMRVLQASCSDSGLVGITANYLASVQNEDGSDIDVVTYRTQRLYLPENPTPRPSASVEFLRRDNILSAVAPSSTPSQSPSTLTQEPSAPKSNVSSSASASQTAPTATQAEPVPPASAEPPATTNSADNSNTNSGNTSGIVVEQYVSFQVGQSYPLDIEGNYLTIGGKVESAKAVKQGKTLVLTGVSPGTIRVEMKRKLDTLAYNVTIVPRESRLTQALLGFGLVIQNRMVLNPAYEPARKELSMIGFGEPECLQKIKQKKDLQGTDLEHLVRVPPQCEPLLAGKMVVEKGLFYNWPKISLIAGVVFAVVLGSFVVIYVYRTSRFYSRMTSDAYLSLALANGKARVPSFIPFMTVKPKRKRKSSAHKPELDATPKVASVSRISATAPKVVAANEPRNSLVNRPRLTRVS